jgi:hypothetical protein
MATVLAEETYTAATLIEPPSPTPPRPPPIALLRRTTTMRPLPSPTSMSRPPTYRTSVLSSRSHWTSPLHTMSGGATTSYSPSSVTLCPITCC